MATISQLWKRARTALQVNRISLMTMLTLIVIWEVAGHLSPHNPSLETPLVPPWEAIFGVSLKGMSDYWKINALAPVPSTGGAQTYLGAFLALGYHSLQTLLRLVLGMILGMGLGTGLGLVISWSPVLRRLVSVPLHVLRMCPLLAMIPLFSFWFGTQMIGAILFVAFGVGVVYFVGTLNAVANIPNRYIEYALTLGSSRVRVYTHVIFPAILPELFSSVFITLGLAWSAVIGAEYVGVESGLGRMIIWAEYFSNTGRMALVTLLIICFAGASFMVFRKIAARILRWMPSSSVV